MTYSGQIAISFTYVCSMYAHELLNTHVVILILIFMTDDFADFNEL